MKKFYPLDFEYCINGEIARNMYDCDENKMIRTARDNWVTYHNLPMAFFESQNAYVVYDNDYDVFTIKTTVLVASCY